MIWVICIVIILLLVWVFYDRLVVEWNIRTVRGITANQSADCDTLNNMLKQESANIAACRKDSSTCGPTQTAAQMTLASTSIGDNQNELSHIRNELTDINRAIDAKEMEMRSQLMRGEMVVAADYEQFDRDIKIRLEATQARLKVIQNTIMSY